MKLETNLDGLSKPFPWDLSAEELLQLDIPTPDKRHYLSLSPAERKFIWETRVLAQYYDNCGMTQPIERPAEQITAHLADFLDKKILAAGLGRAVDYRGTLNALNAWMDYLSWALPILNQKPMILEIALPYRINRNIVLPEISKQICAEGVINLSVVGRFPDFGKKNQVNFGYVDIYLRDETTCSPEDTDQRTYGLLYLINNWGKCIEEYQEYFFPIPKIELEKNSSKTICVTPNINPENTHYHLWADPPLNNATNYVTLSSVIKALEALTAAYNSHLPPNTKPIAFEWENVWTMKVVNQ